MYKILSTSGAYFEYIPDASSLFAILGHDPKAEVWLAIRFYSMGICRKSTVECTTWFEDYFLNCPFIRCVDENILGKTGLVFTDYIEEAVNQGFYISVPINVQYIHNYHMNEEITHEIFIYGYDNDKEVVYIMDHFRNGKFSAEQCTYQEINEAFRRIPSAHNKYEYRMKIRKIKYAPVNQHTYGREAFITLLEDHFYGVNLVAKYPDGKELPNLCDFNRIAFGSEYYDAVAAILRGKYKKLLRRQIYLIYLHLKIFMKLSAIINDKFGIDHIDACTALADDAALLNKKYLKSIFLAPEINQEQVEAVADSILEIKDKEQRLISFFLQDLKLL